MPLLRSGGLLRTRGNSFTGVLDGISNVAVAYSLRKLRSAYAGSACRVRRSSDSTEQDIGFDGSGEFDSASFSAFIGGGTGFVKTWYDQSGNSRDATQATSGNQPVINVSVLNSKAVVSFTSASSQYLSTSTWGGIAQPFTVINCARSNGNASNTDYFYDAINGTSRCVMNRKGDGASANLFSIYSGGTNLGVTDATLNAAAVIFSGLYNGAISSQFWTNGNSRATGNAGTNTLRSVRIGANNGVAAHFLNGFVADLIFVASLSTANHNAIGNNMATRYGLSWTTV